MLIPHPFPLSPRYLLSLAVLSLLPLWIAPVTQAAPAAPGDLVISEVHYNPYDATPQEIQAGKTLASDFEFIEIHNISSVAVELNGVTITGAITFTFSPLSLPADGFTVVAKSPIAFSLRYPTLPAPGNYSGKLSNLGEQIIITSASATIIQSLTYGTIGQWPGRANGKGSSLELIDPDLSGVDFNDPQFWRASSEFNGSPWVAGSGPDNRVVINEVRSHTDLPQVDAIELFNTTGNTIQLGGWLLSDNNAVYPSFSIPPTSIPAGGYLTFDESLFNPTPNQTISSYAASGANTKVSASSHGLSTGDTVTIVNYAGTGLYNGSWKVTVITSNAFSIQTPYVDNNTSRGQWIKGRPFGLSASRGEDLWLLETDSSGKPVKFIDHVDFAASFNGDTLGRWPNATGSGTLVTLTSPTLGSENAKARVGSVILSEVMYAPSPPTGQPDALFEFVEICNTGSTTENLANWRMRGGADFDFTSNHILAPDDLLVVVAFDPLVNTAAATAFRSHYGIDSSVLLVGPFLDGPLDNIDGTVRLQRPDTPPSTDPLLYPQVTEDEVRYQNQSPWPIITTNSGFSINRSGDQLFGNFADSWSGDPSSPGGKRLYYASWSESYFGSGSPFNSGKFDDFDFDGTPNVVEFALGLDPTTADATQIPTVSFNGTNGIFSYYRNFLRSDLTYNVQYSTDLSVWNSADESVTSSGNFGESIQATAPLSPTGTLFMRLSIDSP